MSALIQQKTIVCRFAAKTCGGDSVVCACRAVKESTIRESIDSGEAKTVEEISLKTGAGTGCTACHCRLNRMLAGLPAKCGNRFDLCEGCGTMAAICACQSAA